MSCPIALGRAAPPPVRRRLAARLAALAARLLAALPPRRIRTALTVLRTGAAPATAGQALAAREAVVAVSTRCAGQNCLQRSLATALLCRMGGTWPTWCTGVRTAPFRAHAWVEVDGVPIGEREPPGYYTPTLTVPHTTR
ncbi:lasso peptide biosynthesis B2 protein [Streptomyces sp. NPDC046215]|uniref:Microcin J25-processing protein McjB C-terminal domain-containing protein n=1 Tax=Streptomyces stramineus TaxID=173861 RepID=A0ABN1B4F6_9ACTN